MPTKYVLMFFSIMWLLSCNYKEKKNSPKIIETTTKTPSPISLTKSEKILNETIRAHGGNLYKTAKYSFVFRGNTFQFINDGSNYEYTKTYKKGDSLIKDVLKNGVFTRTVDNTAITLSEKDIASGSGTINSVIYFATLPYKLNDDAVNSKYIENTTIKGKTYDVIEITFNQDGGGEDHDDEYYYWINTNTKKIDYLAYNYSVNKGGVRFRRAYNKRVVNGITFQDYVNYKAPVGTPLKDLPTLFEANQLTELSKINTEDVVNLNK
ncbi:DUF6503 family protein [Algibacter pacificus]|uniref:DUF6503 family protein n=1 Tax=Algibacter pacificus TaxID=2599389 RepID=UPI00164EE900|nr:DUF6503 family protein [Algibacter pacificus]